MGFTPLRTSGNSTGQVHLSICFCHCNEGISQSNANNQLTTKYRYITLKFVIYLQTTFLFFRNYIIFKYKTKQAYFLNKGSTTSAPVWFSGGISGGWSKQMADKQRRQTPSWLCACLPAGQTRQTNCTARRQGCIAG